MNQNDDWPLLNAIAQNNTGGRGSVETILWNLVKTTKQCVSGLDVTNWPCFDYDQVANLRFPRYRPNIASHDSEISSIHIRGNGAATWNYQHDIDFSGFSLDGDWWWRWATTPELLITWVCLAVFLVIVGCCWICTKLSEWLCKIVVILTLTTFLVSAILAFVANAGVL